MSVCRIHPIHKHCKRRGTDRPDIDKPREQPPRFQGESAADKIGSVQIHAVKYASACGASSFTMTGDDNSCGVCEDSNRFLIAG